MEKAIVVTGANGAIGMAGVLGLVGKGFTIFACGSSTSTVKRLQGVHQSVRAVRLDVRSEESIQDAIQIITRDLDGDPLFGCWSNAGVAMTSSLKNMSAAEIRSVIDVNLTGTMLLLNAVYPLLERNRSRVAITGSATGLLAAPAVTAYSAAKWGLEGFADAFRNELSRIGVSLSLIEPGVIRSPMSNGVEQEVAQRLAGMSTQDRHDYEGMMRKIAQMAGAAKTKPETVAKSVVHAFTSKVPQSRYRVGLDARAIALLRYLPDSLKDALLRAGMRH